jgi:hypothetical protein
MSRVALAAPLPVAPRPQADERLSSWLGRLARLYGMRIEAFLECCGLRRGVGDLEWRLGEGEGALLAARAGMTAEAVRALTFEEIAPHARLAVAARSRYACALCPADVHRKAAALPWNFWCVEHGVRFEARAGGMVTSLLPERQLAALDPAARLGARRMSDWAQGDDEPAPGVAALLDFLTTRHRASSPPSLSEQPVLSLEARRANHDFLNRPIARQALLVIVPEYDRVAPVLGKPAPPGIMAVAEGSLLQNYALAVGVGRLTADPVGCAASALLASDPDGEARLRRVLRAWPPALRRRIAGRLAQLRAQRAASAAAATARTGRKSGQSHKFRFSQSHNPARRVS